MDETKRDNSTVFFSGTEIGTEKHNILLALVACLTTEIVLLWQP